MNGMTDSNTIRLFLLITTCFAALFAFRAQAESDTGEIRLVFPYSSEKKSWLTEATHDFHQKLHRISDGRVIRIEAIPMGSGECVLAVLNARDIKPHLTSPASEVFIRLANARVRDDVPIIGPTRKLVVSPVVIAMWEKMAAAIGHGARPIGWKDVFDLVNDPEGWATYDLPEWGRLKFGHTHPEMSNSGLLSLLAIVYAATGKTQDLSMKDIERAETADFLRTIESSVVHYGRSTGFFGQKMFAYGPQNLSCSVLYENMVIESYDPKYKLPEPIVAIYPKEGTFWSDHPVGVVNRPWVTKAHREAARKYIQFLLSESQQEKAMRYGFRPGDVTMELTSPLDRAHGIDPSQPKRLLEIPPTNVVRAILDLWKKPEKACQRRPRFGHFKQHAIGRSNGARPSRRNQTCRYVGQRRPSVIVNFCIKS